MKIENYKLITDFLYVKYGDTIIYADKCEIFPNCGVYLYKNENLIMKVETLNIVIEEVDVFTGQKHYCLKLYNQEDLNQYFGFDTLYLITKESDTEDLPEPKLSFKEGSEVIRVDKYTIPIKNEDSNVKYDSQVIFGMLYAKDKFKDNKEAMEQLNEIIRMVIWTIKEEVSPDIVLIEKDGVKDYCRKTKLTNIEQLENVIYRLKNDIK